MGLDRLKGRLIWSAVLTIAVFAVSRYWELTIAPLPPLMPPPSVSVSVPRTAVFEDKIQKNRTLVATLIDYEVPVAIANEVADLIKPVFDVRKLRFGNPFRLEREDDGTLKKF